MTDMVEKVAMALCQKAIEPKQCPCAETGVFKCRGEHPEAMARAAIRALMEPTPDAILRSGYSKNHWQAMLKAALDE